MTIKAIPAFGISKLASAAALAASTVLVAGCVGGPTYGTGKPAGQQLLEDVTSMASIQPKRGEPIAYTPRPELVEPPTTEILPQPQDDIATASNPQWPESPEQRRARIRAEGEANIDNPRFRPSVSEPKATRGVDPDTLRARSMRSDTNAAINDPVMQREAFNKRLAASQQGSPTERRFLSEPPVEYRQPAATAPTDDVGVDEWRKERDAKKAARKNKSLGWRDFVPFM